MYGYGTELLMPNTVKFKEYYKTALANNNYSQSTKNINNNNNNL